MPKFTIDDDGFLFADGVQVPYRPSPNRGGRIIPKSIIEHDTAGPSVASAVSWFSKRRGKRSASAHVVIGRDGEIVQCVPFTLAAWHAGTSAWKGRAGLNKDSIGIEMVAPGKLARSGSKFVAWWGEKFDDAELVVNKTHGRGYWTDYTQEQLATNQKIVEALVAKYSTINEILGHYHISPGRKLDPAPKFGFEGPRTAFKKAEKPAKKGPKLVTDEERVKAIQIILAQLRYGPGIPDGDIGPRTSSAIFAYQKQNGLKPTGDLDEATAASIEDRAGDILASMPTAGREETTAKEIVKTSRIAKEGAGERNEGVAFLAVGAMATIATQVQSASNVLKSLVDTWGWETLFLFAGVFFLYFGWRRYRKGLRIIWLRLMDHRTGRHIGGPIERVE